MPTHMRPDGAAGWINFNGIYRRTIATDDRFWVKGYGKWYPYGRTPYLEGKWHEGEAHPLGWDQFKAD